jgi:putative ABC transport system substrate-binding protein
MDFDRLRRREFITLLSGGAATWPLAARAQQPERPRRIGVYSGPTQNGPNVQARLGAFRKGLEALGWIEGRNLHIDYRYNTANPAEAAELVALAPEVILSTTPGLRPLQQASRTIPIVFVLVLEPVAEGFVESLSRPGGNMTGFAGWDPVNASKHLQLLKEIAPNINRILYIYNPAVPGIVKLAEGAISVASSFGVEASGTTVRNAIDIERSIEMLAREPNGGLIVPSNPGINENLELIHSLTARYRIPAIGVYRFFPASGGLLSYGFNDVDQFREAASYVDRILKGAKASELPVQYPTKYELVINLKTAKTLGLTVSDKLLSLADEVIE